jgi:DNA-binding IclR family transcriptional regulator
VLDLLLSFGDGAPEHSVQTLARRCATSRSSTYRYLQMLRKRALVTAVRPGHYRLGPRVLDLARVVAGPADLVAVAEPILRQLALETRETVLLTRRVGDRAVCVACVESPQAIRISFEPARNTPLHAGSAAKVLLAHLPDAEIDELLARPLEALTPKTITDASHLRRELAWIRRHGYATSEGEVDAGVRSVSAPVRARDGAVLAGLTLAGPAFRLSAAAVRGLAPRVTAAARRIAATLHGDTGAPARPGSATPRVIRV